MGACEGAAPGEAYAPAGGDVVGADEGPDVGDVVGADELPGLAGRGGAFAAGGGEAAGAGRAGGTVGIADLGAVLTDVAVRADVAEMAPGEVAAADVVADPPDADPLEVGVPDPAGDPEGRLASVEVVEAGLGASDARAVGLLVALELVARVGVASAEAEPDAAPDVEVRADDADADPTAPGAEAAADPRATLAEEAVGVEPAFAGGAGARGAALAWPVCGDVDFDAGTDLFEAGGVVSDATLVADLRAAAGEAEVGVAGAADRVGGTGASPDPRSVASSIGDAQVPEYALSVDVDPGMVGIPNPAGDF
jgi:hypothetical protein